MPELGDERFSVKEPSSSQYFVRIDVEEFTAHGWMYDRCLLIKNEESLIKIKNAINDYLNDEQ